MQKFFFKFTLLIFINLLAFLGVGHILDVLFGGGAKFKVIFLILSIVPLLFIGRQMIQKSLQEFEKIQSPKK